MLSAKNDIDNVVDQLGRSTIATNGVSFEGRSLKLDNEADAAELMSAMSACSDMHFLNLAGNTLGVDAAKAVGKALESHRELKRALWKDLFTGRLKTEIPKALQFLGAGLALAEARLTELDMSDNAFGPIGVNGLAVLLRGRPCYTLQELRLNNNGLGITGGKLLAGALLDCHAESTKAGQPLALKVFVAGRNRLENEGAKAMANVFKTMGSLQEITMPQNGIYHVGIEALAGALTHNPQLRELNLNDNTVTWRGAEHLAAVLPSLPLLASINLGDCLLRTKGAITLAQSLTDNHDKLQEVVMSFNEIGARAVPDLVSMTEGKSELRSLQLDGNHFGPEGREELKSGLAACGRGQALGSLEEDEDEGESEEEGEEEEEEESEGEESEGEEKEADISVLPATPGVPTTPSARTGLLAATTTPKSRGPQTPPGSGPCTPGTGSVVKVPIAIIDVPESPEVRGPLTIQDLMADPSNTRFMALGEDRFKKIIQHFQALSDDEVLDQGVPLMMAVSSSASSPRQEVREAALELATSLFAKLIDWAQQGQHLPALNNALLVHLQLIKSEEKKNRYADVPWNLEGCMVALEQVTRRRLLPFSTKDTLQIFLGRPLLPADAYPETKRKLLTALFQC